jgi:AraC-like DNA-binding protein
MTKSKDRRPPSGAAVQTGVARDHPVATSFDPAAASPALRMSAPGDVRIGPVRAIPQVLAEFGVRPQSAFEQAGVEAGLFDDPDHRVPLQTLGGLLEVCVALTGCTHFGLLVGERFDLAGFGPLGTLMRNAPTVGDAVRSLVLHLHLHDRGAAPLLLAPEPSCITLGYSIYRHGTPATAQIYDAAIAIGYRILAELCGPAWQALQVQFAHGRPRSMAAYRRLFGPKLDFDAEVSGIVFAASWFDQAIEGADARLHEQLGQAIRDAEATAGRSFGEQVQGVMPQMVLAGPVSSEAVARLFAMHERTLRRRLALEGTSLQQLIDQTRFDLARQLLRNTGLSVSAIAAALQYADVNALSRAFRRWAGISPNQWRARH